MDIRLYNKAKAVIEPFAFEKYRKEKIRQQIEANRPARLKIKSNLPAVNQELALKYMDENEKRPSKASNLLQDDRFKDLFKNPEFQVDKSAMEYKMLTPVLSRLERGKVKELKRKVQSRMAFEAEEQAKSSDDDLFSEKDESEDNEIDSSDDEGKIAMQKDLKRTYREIRKEQKTKQHEEGEDDDSYELEQNGDNHKPTSSNGSSNPKLEFKVKNVTSKTNK